MFDFDNNLKLMQKNFDENKNLKKDKYKKTSWVAYDPLNQIYNDLSALYQSGKIAYACLVQANTILFKSFPPLNCPANIIFGTDKSFNFNPERLCDISHELYIYKGANDAPVEIKKITDSITGEMERLFNVPLPLSFSDNKQVYFSTIMVYRSHLPKHKLISSLFPVIYFPEKLSSCVILPKRYWSPDFTQFYLLNDYCTK